MASTRKPLESKLSQRNTKQRSSTSKARPSKDPAGPGVDPGTKPGGGGAGGRACTTATSKRASQAKIAKHTGEDAATEATRRSTKASKVTKARKSSSGVQVPVSNITKQSQAGKSKRKSDAADNAPRMQNPDGEAASKVRKVKASIPIPGEDDVATAAVDAGFGKKAGTETRAAGAGAAGPKDASKCGALSDSSAPVGKIRGRRNRRKSMLLIPLSMVLRSKVFRKTLRRQCAGSESESTMSSKGELSLVMVVMLGAFFFFFMVALLIYYFISGPNLPIAVACISNECLKARQYLYGLLNESKSPCADFYGYVCDSWRDTSSSFHGDIAGKELSMLNESLFHDVRITQDEDKRYGIHVLRPVYRSCYRYMSEAVKLKDALKEAHDLLEITELMKAETFFHVVRYLVRQVIQIGVFTLFKAMFVYEKGRTVLFMGRGYSLQDKLTVPFGTSETRSHFEQILKFWLGRDDVKADLDLLEQTDAKISAIFSRPSSKEEHRRFQDVVSGMVTDVSPEQWLLAVKGAHRETFVLELTDDIIVEGRDAFRPAMQLVADSGLRKAAFYLATNLEADVVFIISKRDKIAQTEAAKAFYCLQFTYKCLTLTWAYLAARYLAAARSIGMLHDILAAIQEAITEEEDTFTWMESSTREKTAEALQKVSLHVIAGRRFNASNVDYNKPDVKLDEGDRFLKVLVTALKLHHGVMAANPPTRLELLISELEFKGTLSLVSSVNYIVVPTLYQHDPYLYTYDVPDYYNYGTMGALIGVQLAEIAAVSVKDQRQSEWDEFSIKKHAELLQCLLARHKQLGLQNFEPSDADKQQTQLLTLSIGVRLAYSALKNVFRIKSKTARVFNDYWPGAMRVFFMRFCLLWCSSSSLTARTQCVLPLYNMQEFADLYGCDADSTGGAVCPT